MDGLTSLGKLLIFLGGSIMLVGLLLVFAPRVPFLGRLPGDILIQRDGLTVYIPLVTMVLLSVLLTILVNVLPRLFR